MGLKDPKTVARMKEAGIDTDGLEASLKDKMNQKEVLK